MSLDAATNIIVHDTDDGPMNLFVCRFNNGVLSYEIPVFVNAPLSDIVERTADAIMDFAELSGSDADEMAELHELVRPIHNITLGELILVCPKCGGTNILCPTVSDIEWECRECGTQNINPVTYNQYQKED